MSLYERLGREAGIRTAVDDFYVRVVADPELAHHVEGIDLGVSAEDVAAVGAVLTAYRDDIVTESEPAA
jgi:truncated hemoglobin YjbI